MIHWFLKADRRCKELLFRHVHENLNIGDAIDYGQRQYKGSLGDLVKKTLNTLEEHGGPHAFHNIK